MFTPTYGPDTYIKEPTISAHKRSLLALGATAAAVMAATTAVAVAAPATIGWDDGTKADVTVNTGESVTWNVLGAGHNVDVWQGPETLRSTAGKDAKGTQFTHTFTKAGVYKYVCDYHSGMRGTITVVAAEPAATPTPMPGPGSGAGSGTGSANATPAPAASSGSGSASATTALRTGQPGTGSATENGPGTVGAPTAADTTALTLERVSLRGSVVRVRVSQAATLTVKVKRTGQRKAARHTVAAATGVTTIRLAKWTKRRGAYRVTVKATDAAGNASSVLRVSVRR